MASRWMEAILARPSAYTAAIWFVALVCIVLTGLDTLEIWRARHAALDLARAETVNLTRSLAEQAHGTLKQAEILLSDLRERLEVEPRSTAALARLREAMLMLTHQSPVVHALFFYDAGGDLVVSSQLGNPTGINYADRAYFQHHLKVSGGGVFLSPPVRSKTDGSWIITASRRVDGADGSFAGIVVATISLDMFRQAYEKIHVGQQGSVTLLYGDGIIVVRAPFRESDIGRNVSGSAWLRDLPKLATPAAVEFTSVLDGIYRLGAAQRVPDQPLVLLVARDRHDVLAGWRRDVTGQLLILAVAVGVLAFVGGCIAVLVREKLKAEALYRLVSDHSSDAIVCMSPNGRWRYVSPAFLGLTGYPANELREMRWNDLVHPDDRAVVQDALSGLETGSGQAVCTYRHICRNGQAVWVEARAKTVADDNGAELVVNIRDIRERRAVEEQLSRANAELMALSMTDGLTGLANRRRFDQRLAIEIGRAAAERHDLALLLIDIDHFKFYNDGYGHPAGDYALQTVARCLDGVIHRPDDLVARYGGEEFVSILPDTHAAGASHVAERIRAAIHDAAITHAGSPTGFVTVSIGIAAARPGDAAALDRLVLDADAALYCAKRGGRDQVIVAGMRDGEPSRAGAPSAEHGELH